MASYEIEIDTLTCIRCGLCSNDAPRTFALGDDGAPMVIDADGSSAHLILQVARYCPCSSIILHDRADGKKIWPRD